MAAAAGIPVPPGAREAIVTWLALLVEWNAKLDLTAARTPAELADLMLADAIALSGRFPHAANLVDVGTGAGGPGLAIALLRPDLRVTLVEPLAKRVSFLRTCLARTRRLDVTLARGKGADQPRGAFDVAISRATLGPAEWLELGVDLVRPGREGGIAAAGGDVWVLLARDDAPSSSRAELRDEIAYTWHHGGQPRRALRFVRTSGLPSSRA